MPADHNQNALGVLWSVWHESLTAGIPLAGGAPWDRRVAPPLPATAWALFWPRLAQLYAGEPAAADNFHLLQLGYLHRAVHQVYAVFFPDRPWLHDVAVAACMLCAATECGQPDHLFFSCPVSLLFWTTVTSGMGLPAPPPLSAHLLVACRPPTDLRHAAMTVHLIWTTYLRRHRSRSPPRAQASHYWTRYVRLVLRTRSFLAQWE